MPKDFRSPNLKRRRIIRSVKRALPWFVVAVLVIFTPIWLLNSKPFRISDVNVSGVVGVDSVEIVALAEDNMLGKYFFIIPRDSSIFYPKEKIVSLIQEKFPRVENVSIELSGSKEISINVRERKTEHLWCSNFPTHCFFMDNSGFIFDSAGDFGEANLFFVYKGHVDGEPIGQQYMTRETFVSVRKLISDIEALGLAPFSLDTLSDTSFELFVGGGSIIFSTDDNLSEVSLNLASILSDTTLSVFQDGKLLVETIDLRYGNRVIIRR